MLYIFRETVNRFPCALPNRKGREIDLRTRQLFVKCMRRGQAPFCSQNKPRPKMLGVFADEFIARSH